MLNAAMDGLITFVSKYFVLIPIFVTLYVFLKLKGSKRQEMLVFLFCASVISIVLAKIGGHIFNDTRPYISDGTPPLFAHSGDPNGFPSDHTLLSAYLAFVVFYYSRKLGIFLLIVAALVGWARVAAHVHHVIDIAGSFVITGLAYLIVLQLLKNKKATRILRVRNGAHQKENN
jgi:membrane-associated phospholipid phosphatase